MPLDKRTGSFTTALKMGKAHLGDGGQRERSEDGQPDLHGTTASTGPACCTRM